MRKILFLTVLLLSVGAVKAQDLSVVTIVDKDEYVVGDFWSNWYLSGGAGVSLPIQRSASHKYFDLDPSFAFSVSLGKWITPFVSLRANYSYSTLKGNDYTKGVNVKTGTTALSGNFSVFSADAMLNLSALIWGYNENRVYQLMPYVGAGLGRIHGSSKTTANDNIFKAVPTVGIVNDFRICNSLSVMCDINASLVNGKYYGSSSSAKVAPINITAGLTYYFGRNARKFKTVQTSNSYLALASVVGLLEGKINNLEYENAASNAEISNLKDALNKAKSEKADRPARTEGQGGAKGQGGSSGKGKVIFENTPVAVFFNINSAAMSVQDIARLKYVAEAMKEQSSTKFVINGYADSETGTPAYNQKLSNERANAVYDVLVKTYGVNPSQLNPMGRGAVADKFDISYLNRFAVIKVEK